MTIEMRLARKEDLAPIAKNMRQADVLEAKRYAGWKPYIALKRSLRQSAWAYTVLEEDEPIAMFGIAPTQILSDMGYPWFMGTDRVFSHRKILIRYGRYYVRKMREDCPILRNTVDPENKKAVRFIKYLGFEIKEDTIKTPKGFDFLQFEMGGDNV